jgi:hypothetical protein
MLKCIENEWPNDNLTIGKLYEPNKDDLQDVDDYYYLEGDNGIFKFYSKECFIDVQKIRHDKLNELGI